MLTLVIILLLLLFIVYIFCTKSTFIADILSTNYNNVGCSNENRVYPSGRVPGSYLGLTDAEKNGLLKEYIKNNKYIT